MNIIEPNLNGEHLRIGIVQARFTNEVGSAMLKAAVEKLHELGVKDDNITVTTVPGALEVPLVLQSMAGTQRFDALIAIGCVIRGETYHFELVSNESAVFITLDGKLHSRQCARQSKLAPCLFEYVYFARPDSVIDGVSVYQARVNMGVKLAEKVKRELDLSQIDVVMPIPDTSRPSAMELAAYLGKPYREGFIKNRYIGRTFIMPGQATRKKSVRQKLNPMDSEFKGKNILLVDDSIVRGTTSREIVEMAKASGAEKVFFASAAPEVRYPNVYGIDMPTREELIANGRTAAEVAAEISADGCVFQDLDELKAVIREMNPKIEAFDDSCFSGLYLTGDIDENYLQRLSASKSSGAAAFVQPGLIDHSVRVENGNEE